MYACHLFSIVLMYSDLSLCHLPKIGTNFPDNPIFSLWQSEFFSLDVERTSFINYYRGFQFLGIKFGSFYELFYQVDISTYRNAKEMGTKDLKDTTL